MKKFFMFLLFAGLVAAAAFIWRRQSEDSGIVSEFGEAKMHKAAVGE